jgi:hypothetical protein
MPLEDWYRQHWAQFPATSPDGGRIIDNDLPDLLDG